MLQTAKRFFWQVLFACIGLIAFAFFVYVQDLATRYPGLDTSRMRLGLVSWYSEFDPHINPRTASGEIFDQDALTCASWDFDFNEKLLIINLLNGKRVVCRVNDRGPNKRLGREVDLTRAAFARIANPKRGLIYAAAIPTEMNQSKAGKKKRRK